MKLCLLTLSAAVLSTSAVASDLPKEGKVSATYNSVGSYKPITAGKNLGAWIFDESGFQLPSRIRYSTTSLALYRGWLGNQ